ncbi:hypothetical protein ACFX1X_029095 [Malus domestica]
MHVDLVIIFKMHHKELDISSDRTFSSSIRAAVRAIFTGFLVLQLAVVWEYILATINLVSTRKIQRLCYFLQCQAPYISKFIPASGATVVHSNLTARAESMAIWTLQYKLQ